MNPKISLGLIVSLLLVGCSPALTDADLSQTAEHVRYSDAAAAQQQADDQQTQTPAGAETKTTPATSNDQ